MAWVLALIGCVVGFLVGLTSTGGGALLTPALLLFGLPASIAVGTDALVTGVMKIFGSLFYAQRREVHWITIYRLALGSIPGALIGTALLNLVPHEELDPLMRAAVGAILILAGLITIARLRYSPRCRATRLPSVRLLAALGLVTGLLVSVTSIGSGCVLLPLLALFVPVSAQMIVGTDMVHALILLVVVTGRHLAAGRIDFTVAAALLAGGVPGVLLGARLAGALPQRLVRVGLAGLLLVLGVHLTLPARHASYAYRAAQGERR